MEILEEANLQDKQMCCLFALDVLLQIGPKRTIRMQIEVQQIVWAKRGAKSQTKQCQFAKKMTFLIAAD